MTINLNDLEIRKATDEDADYLLDMVRRVTLKENVKFLCKDTVNEYVASGNCDLAVLENLDKTLLLIHQDRIIGYAAWNENYLEAVMLDNEFYGSGAAVWFMERMQDQVFKEHDLLKLDVFKDNLRALRFYRKLGWHVYGHHTHEVIGVKLWDLCMVKDEGARADRLTYRNEKEADHWMVENMTREAFFNLHGPGCVEHYLAHILRDSQVFVGELDMVAEVDGLVVANIMYTRAQIAEDSGQKLEVLCFGPLSVLPAYHGRGIGSRLIDLTAEKARDMGYKAILIYGDPEYYSKVGFLPAEKYGIGTSDNMYLDSLQALELVDGALAGAKGRFVYDSVYEIDEVASAEFDRGFPRKEKLEGLPSHKRFAQAIKKQRPRN